MKKCVTSFLIVTVVMTAAAAGAEPSPRQAKSVTAAPDSDKPALRPPAADALFQTLDTDRNGVVSESELAAAAIRHVRERVLLRFAQLDHNRDGRVSRDEVAGMSLARFNRFDLNRDGAFTASELLVVMESKMIPRVARFLPRIDTDGDGRCSKAELEGHFERVARQKAPANKDSAVAGAEKPARTKTRPTG